MHSLICDTGMQSGVSCVGSILFSRSTTLKKGLEQLKAFAGFVFGIGLPSGAMLLLGFWREERAR